MKLDEKYSYSFVKSGTRRIEAVIKTRRVLTKY